LSQEFHNLGNSYFTANHSLEYINRNMSGALSLVLAQHNAVCLLPLPILSYVNAVNNWFASILLTTFDAVLLKFSLSFQNKFF